MNSPVAPAIAWNMAKRKEFDLRFNIKPEIPAVVDQIPGTVVNPKSLFPFAYNCSIFRFSGRIFLAYRWHEKRSWETSLAIAELDEKFNVKENKRISLPGPANDDPRLFEHKNWLYVSYVSASKIDRTTIRYGRLIEGKEWTVEGQFQVKYGKNDGSSMEKNWVPFVWNNKIHFIYQIHTVHKVIEVDDSSVVNEHIGSPGSWIWGQMRGGTTPLKYNGGWIRFFHSRLDNEPSPNRIRYHVGALKMESNPPFSITQVCKKPVLIGSELDTLSEEERSRCRFHFKNVVFPLGAIEHNDGWILSVGANHCSCVLVNVKEKDLIL